MLKIKIGCGNMKKSKVLLTSLMLASVLSACNNNASTKETTAENNPVVKTTSSEVKQTTTQEKVKNEKTSLGLYNEMAKNSKSTEEIYVTGDVEVGEGKDVSPGIYDLEITGGSGNILGTRKSLFTPFINFLGGAPGTSNRYASKIRVILFDGDVLKFRNISKIKFTAIPEEVQMSNELGVGEYVVGRDIKPGTYKLSTNKAMNSEYKNLGWDVNIVNETTKKSKQQRFNPGNPDVVVKLEEGEIISTMFQVTSQDGSVDDARLIFTEYK